MLPTTSSPTTPVDPSVGRPAPELLVSGDSGVVIVADGVEEPVIETAVPVRLAHPDHAGGVVYQLDTPNTPAPIYRITGPGAAPSVVVAGEPFAEPWFHNVAVIEGRPTLVYTVAHKPCDSEESCADLELRDLWAGYRQELLLLDLESGAPRSLGMIGEWESIAASSSVGGGLIAHSWYDDLGLVYVVFHDLDGNRRDFEGNPCSSERVAQSQIECPHVNLSADGSRLFAFGKPCWADDPECVPRLRIFDLTDGELLFASAIGDIRERPLWLDGDADSTVVATQLPPSDGETGRRVYVLDSDGDIVDSFDVAGGRGGVTLWHQ